MKKVIISTVFAIGLVVLAAASAFAQTSVAGEWDGAFNTPGGPRPVKFIFKVDGEKLSGTAKRTSGDVPLTGTIKGNVITFSYTVSYNDNPLTLSFGGTVNGDIMSGTVSFGESGEGADWSAKRTPPPAEKPKSN
ncbi:MAG TPA: hypothetical protein PLL77_15000 [Pyrinomonadaceae bacterium]|nr:hypothetical protein [Pyrinomonadaceae bacterium]